MRRGGTSGDRRGMREPGGGAGTQGAQEDGKHITEGVPGDGGTQVARTRARSGQATSKDASREANDGRRGTGGTQAGHAAGKGQQEGTLAPPDMPGVGGKVSDQRRRNPGVRQDPNPRGADVRDGKGQDESDAGPMSSGMIFPWPGIWRGGGPRHKGSPCHFCTR
ncbi:unnamed protein product [Prunus armeniaca]|uniref:Uncharacterized protein n=1 Tax=Prunus armeniaca TaxID=36596 RepID=A0A6J5V3B4_PRUAR|nr:unnamed protein product [Prunus armeniaca]